MGSFSPFLLILWVMAPLIPNQADYVVEFFFDLVLIAGAYSAAWQSKHRMPFLALTAVTLVTRWTDMIVDHSGFSLVSIGLILTWLVYVIGLVVAALFRMQRVGTNAILGAIVAYMLAAVAFASCFQLIELLQPNSFSGLPAGGVQRQLEHALLYFSFVSITTMGYGDILPVSELARSVSFKAGGSGLAVRGFRLGAASSLCRHPARWGRGEVHEPHSDCDCLSDPRVDRFDTDPRGGRSDPQDAAHRRREPGR